jgi:hypothetical protein
LVKVQLEGYGWSKGLAMNCTTCDTPLEPGALFCANCGARVAPASSAAAPTIVLPAPAQPPPAAPDMPQPFTPPPLYAGQYGAPAQPYAPPNSNAAVISLIFGILAWVGLVFIGAIVAIIAGHMARREIRDSGGRIGGGGMAMAGLLLGYVQLGLLLLGCAVVLLLALIGVASGRP